MRTTSRIAAAGLVALSALGLGAGLALAQTQPQADDAAQAQALTAATVKLAQAISATETATGGTVASIEFDHGDDGEPNAWDVEVLLADGTFKHVEVDAQTAAVTDAVPDHEGSEDGEDDE